MTIPLINNAKRITFIVTGEIKANVLKKVVYLSTKSRKYLATYISPKDGTLEWYVDMLSGKYLK